MNSSTVDILKRQLISWRHNASQIGLVAGNREIPAALNSALDSAEPFWENKYKILGSFLIFRMQKQRWPRRLQGMQNLVFKQKVRKRIYSGVLWFYFPQKWIFASLNLHMENRFQTLIHYDALRVAAGHSCSRANSGDHCQFCIWGSWEGKGQWESINTLDKLCQHNVNLQWKAGALTLGKNSLLLWPTCGGRRVFSKQLSGLPCHHFPPNMHQKARQNCSNVIYLVTIMDFCSLNCSCIHNQVLVCF